MNKRLTIINIVLALLAIFLAYKVFDSVRQPVVFENTRTEREAKIIKIMKEKRNKKALLKKN